MTKAEKKEIKRALLGKIEPTADSPHPDFKPVTAERLGTGLFTGEEFPLPDTELSTPNGSNACASL